MERVSREERVEAVFFDLDDTLVSTRSADLCAYNSVCILLSQHYPLLNHKAVIEFFISEFSSHPWDPTNQIEVTEWRAGIWARALEAQGVEDLKLATEMQCCFDSTRLSSFQWVPGAEEVVKTLQDKGIKVGIITNGHPKIQRAKLSACRGDDLFRTILVGGEETYEKPHQSIFSKACELEGCDPQHSIMVGDNLKTDIQGGVNAGFLATVWVNIHNTSVVDFGTANPTYIVKSVNDLLEILSFC